MDVFGVHWKKHIPGGWRSQTLALLNPDYNILNLYWISFSVLIKESSLLKAVH